MGQPASDSALVTAIDSAQTPGPSLIRSAGFDRAWEKVQNRAHKGVVGVDEGEKIGVKRRGRVMLQYKRFGNVLGARPPPQLKSRALLYKLCM
ncbi:MAG: hypothetical protein M1813_002732 [Trichoglossum hirsutum]|nr:MAG: hypothetical protein M1813_002732 [Trichoglossum hirsutum]